MQRYSCPLNLLLLHYCCWFRLDLKLLLRVGFGSKEIFDIQMNDLTTDVVDAMSAVHALSGCDYKSSFSGIGKAKVP